MQCAELRGHYDSGERLAARVAVLARQYNKALVAVERNNHGHAVLAYLAMTDADVLRYHVKGKEGWLTSTASRPRMLDNMAAVLEAAPFLFNSAAAGGVQDVRAASGWYDGERRTERTMTQ